MSNYSGIEPADIAHRWDKGNKEYTNVDRPYIIKEYNTHMVGVDILDAHISRCKDSIWTRRVEVINEWLLIKRNCSLLAIADKNKMKLRQCQAKVAQALIERGTARKSGRPSLDKEISPKLPKIIRTNSCARFD